MLYPIELKDTRKRVTVHNLINATVLRAEVNGVIQAIHPPTLIAFCSWCHTPEERKVIADLGFQITDSICQHCSDRELEKHRKQQPLYERED